MHRWFVVRRIVFRCDPSLIASRPGSQASGEGALRDDDRSRNAGLLELAVLRAS
jgi:hypothetical protein